MINLKKYSTFCIGGVCLCKQTGCNLQKNIGNSNKNIKRTTFNLSKTYIKNDLFRKLTNIILEKLERSVYNRRRKLVNRTNKDTKFILFHIFKKIDSYCILKQRKK